MADIQPCWFNAISPSHSEILPGNIGNDGLVGPVGL